LSLDNQVAALADLVRLLLVLGAVQTLVIVGLVVYVARLRGTVREMGEQLDNLDEHVRDAIEGDVDEANATAARALRIVTDEAADAEREFIRRTERPRAPGGE
jgi:hypothetical protein